jgi:AraC-like DNA-binding protein
MVFWNIFPSFSVPSFLHASRAFKGHAGMTPKQFRQQATAEAADAC